MLTHFFSCKLLYAMQLNYNLKTMTTTLSNRKLDALWCFAGSQHHTAPTDLSPEIKRIGRD